MSLLYHILTSHYMGYLTVITRECKTAVCQCRCLISKIRLGWNCQIDHDAHATLASCSCSVCLNLHRWNMLTQTLANSQNWNRFLYAVSELSLLQKRHWIKHERAMDGTKWERTHLYAPQKSKTKCTCLTQVHMSVYLKVYSDIIHEFQNPQR